MRTNRHITALEQADAMVRAGATAAQDSHQDATALLSSVGEALDALRDGLPGPAGAQQSTLLARQPDQRAPRQHSRPPRPGVPFGRWAAMAAAIGGFGLFASVFVWTPETAGAVAPQPAASPVVAAAPAAAAITLASEVPRAVSAVPDAPDAAPISASASLDAGSQMYAGLFGKTDRAEVQCLAEAIYYEARGEPVIGQIAVAQVVLNRVRAGHWGSSICRVVTQGISRGEKCQFSFACRTFRTKPVGDAWTQARDIASDAVQGRAWLRELAEATHYHALSVAPVWRLDLELIGTYGQHIFYKSRDLPSHLTVARALERHELEASAATNTTVPRAPRVGPAAPVTAALKPRPARAADAKAATSPPAGDTDWIRSLNVDH